jgi:hypothetical protein
VTEPSEKNENDEDQLQEQQRMKAITRGQTKKIQLSPDGEQREVIIGAEMA